MVKTVLVLGGGTGGVVAANVLRKTLAQKHQIIVVDRNKNHYFQASYPLVLVNLRRPEQIIRSLEKLRQKGIEFVQSEVEQVCLEQRIVKTSGGDLEYDYLVISLGAEHHPETVPGQAQGAHNPYNFEGICRLRQELSVFNRGKIVLFISNLPYTGVIAPYEIMFLMDAYFRKRNLRQQVKLTLVTPESSPLPLAGPKVGESLRRMMEQRQIELITQAKTLFLNPEARQLVLDGGTTVSGDLFMGIPSHWGPSAVRDSDLAVEGRWIEVDHHTLETSAEQVFAVGDATAIRLPITKAWAPKAGVFAHYQAEVVARNIALQIAGKKPRFHYTGKAAGAVMATELGRGRFASVNYYATPRARVNLLRPTRTAYWAKVAFERYWLGRWF